MYKCSVTSVSLILVCSLNLGLDLSGDTNHKKMSAVNFSEEDKINEHLETLSSSIQPMILPGCQTSDSASSSEFHHWPLLALLVALVLH